MKKNSVWAIFVISITLSISCDRPECTNENPIFDTNEPNSKIYKEELAQQLAQVDESELRYWFQKYEDKEGIESLYFYVQSDSLCAVLYLTMNHWEKLERVREKKGVGRRGAEFTNLSYEIVQDSLSTRFIYNTFDRIID